MNYSFLGEQNKDLKDICERIENLEFRFNLLSTSSNEYSQIKDLTHRVNNICNKLEVSLNYFFPL